MGYDSAWKSLNRQNSDAKTSDWLGGIPAYKHHIDQDLDSENNLIGWAPTTKNSDWTTVR